MRVPGVEVDKLLPYTFAKASTTAALDLFFSGLIQANFDKTSTMTSRKCIPPFLRACLDMSLKSA